MSRKIEGAMISKLQSFFRKFPTMELGNIRLRDMRLNDSRDYYEYLNHPMVQQYLSDEDVPSTEDEALQCVKMWGSLFYKKQGIFWTIADSKTDHLIGSIGFCSWNFYNKRGEISYDIAHSYWGQGIASKALSNILRLAFGEMMLYRIEARTMQGNEVSQHILTKMGFKQEGILRGYRTIRGRPEDIIIYSLIRPDYPDYLLT